MAYKTKMYHVSGLPTAYGFPIPNPLSSPETAITPVVTSTGGALTIQQNGVIVGVATTLNFMGNQVSVFEGATPGQIVVQIPPSSYAAHLNQGTALIPDTTTVSRYVAFPGGAYNIGSWTAGTAHAAFNSSSLTYATSNYFSIFDATSTTINVSVIDADGITVLSSHTKTITGNLNATVGNIQIQITGFTTDTDQFKAYFSTTINIGSILPAGGRFSVHITHTDASDGGPYLKQQNDIFYDPNSAAPSMNNPTFSDNAIVVGHNSGVAFYQMGSTFNAAINNINNLNNSSYPDTPIVMNGNAFGLPALNITPAMLTGWTTSYNNTGSSYLNSSWTVNTSNVYSIGPLTINAHWVDWVNGATQPSLVETAIVNTLPNNNTTVYTDFNNESARLKNDLLTAWDSSQDLTTYDGGNGLQILGGKLIYPAQDFSSYSPNSGSQPSYVGASGAKTYNTFMSKPGVSNSNGIFQLTGTNITEAMITAGDVLIQISLDKTNWYSLNSPYLGGPLSNGDGCRVDDSTSNLTLNGQLAFTFGPGKFTDLTSNWGMFIKVTYAGTVPGMAAYIDSLSSSTW